MSLSSVLRTVNVSCIRFALCPSCCAGGDALARRFSGAETGGTSVGLSPQTTWARAACGSCCGPLDSTVTITEKRLGKCQVTVAQDSQSCSLPTLHCFIRGPLIHAHPGKTTVLAADSQVFLCQTLMSHCLPGVLLAYSANIIDRSLYCINST